MKSKRKNLTVRDRSQTKVYESGRYNFSKNKLPKKRVTENHRQKGRSNMKFIRREKDEEKEKKINVSKKMSQGKEREK
jgi:hypothetical protein